MSAHFEGSGVTLHHGDCLDVLRSLPDASVDSVVTDPPYGLEFMGKEWDAPWRQYAPKFQTMRPTFAAGIPFQQWCELWATECLRVLKPGGHLLAFGGTRTWHRLACAVEDAGFEVRDSIAWLYGSGFPKSLDVSKAIDKAAGALEHEGHGFTVAGRTDKNLPNPVVRGYVPPAPATPDAERWQGWGTALKPAFEPVVVARKPLVGTVAANVLTHGTGALNVDGCRIGEDVKIQTAAGSTGGAWIGPVVASQYEHGTGREYRTGGRWPANVILDEDMARVLDEQSGERKSSGVYDGNGSRRGGDHATDFGGANRPASMFADPGGASRFMYTAKADASERPRVNGTAHPTVKPLALMRWLVRLVTPPGGTVLEPFAGSGTTVEACLLEGFRCIAVEKTDEYLPLILARIHRQRDPVEAIRLAGDDLGLFELGGEGA